MTRRKLVLVPFPFDDLSDSKVRPALCLTDPIGPNRHVVLAFLTSRIELRVPPTDLVLSPNAPDSLKPDFALRPLSSFIA